MFVYYDQIDYLFICQAKFACTSPDILHIFWNHWTRKNKQKVFYFCFLWARYLKLYVLVDLFNTLCIFENTDNVCIIKIWIKYRHVFKRCVYLFYVWIVWMNGSWVLTWENRFACYCNPIWTDRNIGTFWRLIGKWFTPEDIKVRLGIQLGSCLFYLPIHAAFVTVYECRK